MVISKRCRTSQQIRKEDPTLLNVSPTSSYMYIIITIKLQPQNSEGLKVH